MYRTPKGVQLTRKERLLLQALMQYMARLDDMVNVSELLIKTVKRSKPKMLIGLNQKV